MWHFLCKCKVLVVSQFSLYTTLIFCGHSTPKAITKLIILELIYVSQVFLIHVLSKLSSRSKLDISFHSLVALTLIVNNFFSVGLGPSGAKTHWRRLSLLRREDEEKIKKDKIMKIKLKTVKDHNNQSGNSNPVYTCIHQSSNQVLLLIDLRSNLKKLMYDEFTDAFALLDSRGIDTVIDDSTGWVLHSKKKYFQEYWVSSHVLFTCVTYFAELLLWLAIKNASASINDSTGWVLHSKTKYWILT